MRFVLSATISIWFNERRAKKMFAVNSWPCLLWTFFAVVAPLQIHAEYGTGCTNQEGVQGKCVPIASCTNIESQLKEIQAGHLELTPEFASKLRKLNCGEYDGVRHICCAETQIQYNSNTMAVLKELKCGDSTGMRVAHGYEVKLGTRPWMALLRYRVDGESKFLCGGTLISELYVLTAAHCIAGKEDQLYQVRLGEHKISTEPDCVFQKRRPKCSGPVQDVDVKKIIVHEAYTPTAIYDDIALLQLDHAVEFQKHIKPICLPITPELQQLSGTIPNFFVTGWGATENGSNSDVLLEARVANQGRGNCSEAFQREILTSQICAGGDDLKDSCKGDSGGPIQGPGSYLEPYRVRMVQFGIVSVGVVSCGRAGLPGLYTNVSAYIQWITDKMDSH